uniref:Uncharacterized protein n=1 Tax=Clytia hemisphaerica TaxID=252671 RepID=A0A7M5VF26_9CNID
AILFCKSCKGYNIYQKFLIPSQSYTKEGEVFRTKSPTEWLLRCGKRRSMNTIIEDENCQCTTSNCVKEESEASGNPSNVQCYQTPFIPPTLTPICFEAKNNQYASFTIPLKGKINSIKLQHASGGIT